MKYTITPLSVVFLLVILSGGLLAQNVGVNTSSPHSSASLEVFGTDKGMLLPRVSLSDVNNATSPINAPATGLIVYNTNAAVTGGSGTGFYFFNGSSWVRLTSTADNDIDWLYNGSDIYKANAGNVGIGITNPQSPLHVVGSNNIISIDATGAGTGARSTAYFMVDGDDWEIGARGSTGGPNNSFYLYNTADGQYRMVVSDIGHVGIGNTTAQHLLSVGPASGDNQLVSLRVYSNDPPFWKGGAAFGYTSNTVIIGELNGVATIGGHNANLSAWSNLAINPDGGYVAIGHYSPEAKLHIRAGGVANPNNNALYIYNPDAGGDAIATVRVNQGTGGDAFYSMDVNGVTGWSMGIDNSDADKFKIANSWSSVAANTKIAVHTDGTAEFFGRVDATAGLRTERYYRYFTVHRNANGAGYQYDLGQWDYCAYAGHQIALGDDTFDGGSDNRRFVHECVVEINDYWTLNNTTQVIYQAGYGYASRPNWYLYSYSWSQFDQHMNQHCSAVCVNFDY